MKLLYHQAVLELIATPRNLLTLEDAEIYCSYLAYKHVAFVTKRAILTELGKRAQSPLDAAATTGPIMGLVPELLASPDIHIQRLTCWVLGILANQDRTGNVVSTYTRLASSLTDEETEIIMRTMFALGGAQTAVDSKVKDVLKEFVEAVCLVFHTCQTKVKSILVVSQVSGLAVAVARHIENHNNEDMAGSLFLISSQTRHLEKLHMRLEALHGKLGVGTLSGAGDGYDSITGLFSKRKTFRGWLSTPVDRIEIPSEKDGLLADLDNYSKEPGTCPVCVLVPSMPPIPMSALLTREKHVE